MGAYVHRRRTTSGSPRKRAACGRGAWIPLEGPEVVEVLASLSRDGAAVEQVVRVHVTHCAAKGYGGGGDAKMSARHGCSQAVVVSPVPYSGKVGVRVPAELDDAGVLQLVENSRCGCVERCSEHLWLFGCQVAMEF